MFITSTGPKGNMANRVLETFDFEHQDKFKDLLEKAKGN